tara:strand:- start:566 stop:892 length:327 start_codon:yes stop_codon:yes gene_type:complete
LKTNWDYTKLSEAYVTSTAYSGTAIDAMFKIADMNEGDLIRDVREATVQPSNYFDLVTFGSSFNVCDPKLAIKETARILRKKGWIACLYNNRNLKDPIQSKIESLITR